VVPSGVSTAHAHCQGRRDLPSGGISHVPNSGVDAGAGDVSHIGLPGDHHDGSHAAPDHQVCVGVNAGSDDSAHVAEHLLNDCPLNFEEEEDDDDMQDEQGHLETEMISSI